MPNRVTKGKALMGAVNVPASGLYIGDVAVAATAAELNRVADVSGRVINGTASGTVSVTEEAYDGKTTLLNLATGFTVALPAATGSGMRLKFVVASTTSSGGYIIRAAGNDAFWGVVHQVTDNAGMGTSVWGFKSGGGTVITLNGSTTGGIKGDVIELEDILADIWFVNMRTAATGAEATPFS